MNSDMEERLLAYFHGEADETERKEVERWLGEAPENREAYRRLVRDCLFVRWAGREQRIDAVERKSRLLRLMRRRRTRKMWPRVAAAVAVLVVAGGMWWLSDFGRKERPLARAERPIVPGSQKAVLVLSTGEQVDLTQSEGDIREQDGSVVRLNGEKRVVYDTARTNKDEKLIYNKIVVPRGGEFFLTLADGTEVWLNAETELEYPVRFAGDRRDVQLKGEAYFKVKSDSVRPFRVRSGEYELRVYGTEFNLDAYHEERVRAVLVEGSVGFRANARAGERQLKPNQLGVANTRTGEVEVRDVDVYPYVAWRTQDMVFVNERLESIMEKVERWYNMDVFFQNERLKEARFYGNMKRYTPIEDLLFFLERTSDARFSINGRTIVVGEK